MEKERRKTSDQAYDEATEILKEINRARRERNKDRGHEKRKSGIPESFLIEATKILREINKARGLRS